MFVELNDRETYCAIQLCESGSGSEHTSAVKDLCKGWMYGASVEVSTLKMISGHPVHALVDPLPFDVSLKIQLICA